MKALTICQPYAELIVRGPKRVENRRHARLADFRGPLLIHAGKSREWLDPGEDGRDGVIIWVERKASTLDPGEDGRDETYGIRLSEMAFGAIVGRALVVDFVAVTYDGCRHPVVPAWARKKRPWLATHEHVEGPYCLVFASILRLERPFPCRGQQGLFDVEIEDLEMEHGWPAVWLPAGPPARSCRVCGCTEHSPCDDGMGGSCCWIGEDLCSACEGRS